MREIEREISVAKIALVASERELTRTKTLLDQGVVSARDVSTSNEYVAQAKERLAKLEEERDVLAKKVLTESVPNDQIRLLQILVTQNERILDSFEKLLKQQ